MAHAVVIVPLALKSLQSKVLAEDPVFGYDPMVGDVLAMSSGYVIFSMRGQGLMRRYFIWDTIDSMLNSTIGFVVHGESTYLDSYLSRD